MSDGDALVRAVCEHPDEDTPRLAYADWLDEHGDPVRAEFIRLQCRLAHLAEGDPGRAELGRRADELARVHGPVWAAPLGPGVRPRTRWDDASAFGRGFVEEVTMSAARFLRRAGWLYGRAPVRRVRLTRAAGLIGRLAACPHLARLAGLSLAGNRLVGPEAVDLARCPHLDGLTHLDVSVNRVGPRGAVALLERLAGRPGAAVEFGGNRLGPAGAAALARSPGLATHTALLVGSNRMGDGAIAALLDSPYTESLRVLDLTDNEAGGAAVAALAGRARPALAELYLRKNRLGDAGARTLAEGSDPSGVRILNAGLNGVGDAGAAALAGGRAFPALQALCLSWNRIGDAGAVALARSAALPALRTLDLSGNRIGGVGAVALARSAALPALRTLDLSGNRIGNAGALAFLEQCPAGLEELNLIGNPISRGTALALRSAAGGLRVRVHLPLR
jgi:uncharacterized protein (TIGR02996 family)